MQGSIVGRSDTLNRLTDLVRAADDASRAVVVVGDQGIGKSRLLSAWSQQLRARGFVVLSGRCIDVGDLWPYHPIRGALEQATSDDTPSALRNAAAELLRMLDSGVRGDSDNWLLPRLHQGLSGLARGHLLVLVLDDMQWMDSSTRGLVLALLSGLCAARVLILAAVRSEDLDTDPVLRRLLRELANSQTTEIMELGPLDRAATVALARSLTGQPLSAQATSRLWELAAEIRSTFRNCFAATPSCASYR